MIQRTFRSFYALIRARVLRDLSRNGTHSLSREQRVYMRSLMDYNCLGGKQLRGQMVPKITASLLNRGNNLKTKELSIACGWAIEVLQASFLLHDDIIDRSLLRRGKPCWYTLPNIGSFKAINDGLILQSFVFQIVARYASDTKSYAAISNAFHVAIHKTTLGQFCDITSSLQDISKGSRKTFIRKNFTMRNYRRVTALKTSWYTFWLPLKLALILSGRTCHRLDRAVERIAEILGLLFQMQDDYIDCFGDPLVTGKEGSDIREGKCTWITAMFLKKANASAIRKFCRLYGTSNKLAERQVLSLFHQAEMEKTFALTQHALYTRLMKISGQLQDPRLEASIRSVVDGIIARKR